MGWVNLQRISPLEHRKVSIMDKPFSQACANNQQPILEILTRVFADATDVLEIGSGTGQHAVYIGEALRHLRWRTGDLEDRHAGIMAWLDEAGLSNVESPINLDVFATPWPIAAASAIYSANTAHIISWDGVCSMIAEVARLLRPGGRFALYGPFNYKGTHTSEGNARFDTQLRANGSVSGIRDFEAVNALAESHGLRLLEDNAMPANNRLLVWARDP